MAKNIDSHPVISIVIPVYNGEKTLLNTLSSVLNQIYTHFEIIVVDDGSDNPVEVFLQQHINDNRIRVYRTEHSNANVARNYGIQKGKGEYIAMLDADDYWLENHLADCLKLLNESKADGLYGSIIMYQGQYKEVNKGNILCARKLKKDESIVDYLLTTGCGAQTSTLFTTMQSMKDILWNPSLIDHQDYDFVTRFYRKYTMVPKKEPSVVYSLSSGRKPHFETCIQFVEENKQDINPAVYTQYNKKMYISAVIKQAPENIIAYFRKEATIYKEYLSYSQYLYIMNPQTFYQIVWSKIIYLFYIMHIHLTIRRENLSNVFKF